MSSDSDAHDPTAAPAPDTFRGLEFVDGPRHGEQVPMLRAHFEIGASVLHGLSLPWAGLEPRHCLIRRDEDATYQLVSYDTGCAPTVNGQPVDHQALSEGDVIGLGSQLLVFRRQVSWDPDGGRDSVSSSLPATCRGSLDQLRQVMEPLSHRLRCLCMLLAAERALPVWERHAASRELSYVDSVVGQHHVVDQQLPRRVLAFVGASVDQDRMLPCYQLSAAYSEPLTALQDGDLTLPDHAEMAFYGIYNAYKVCCGEELPGSWVASCALAIHQSLVALILSQGRPEPERVEQAFERWWDSCRDRAQRLLHGDP